ncbi:hypothetical protein J6590_081797 [Homalodisca vitripennis]|nr:hypothetical protein J6590_081797 [Homalodisca vitripennis]
MNLFSIQQSYILLQATWNIQLRHRRGELQTQEVSRLSTVPAVTVCCCVLYASLSSIYDNSRTYCHKPRGIFSSDIEEVSYKHRKYPDYRLCLS